jgi:hypothetical protein
MDITVIKTQKTFYQVDSTLAALLLEAFPQEFERVERPAPAPRATEPQWGIGKTLGGYVSINLRLPSGEMRSYDGPPEDAANGFKLRQWSGAEQTYVVVGPVPPESIIAMYTAQYVPRMR